MIDTSSIQYCSVNNVIRMKTMLLQFKGSNVSYIFYLLRLKKNDRGVQ